LARNKHTWLRPNDLNVQAEMGTNIQLECEKGMRAKLIFCYFSQLDP